MIDSESSYCEHLQFNSSLSYKNYIIVHSISRIATPFVPFNILKDCILDECSQSKKGDYILLIYSTIIMIHWLQSYSFLMKDQYPFQLYHHDPPPAKTLL